MPNDTSYSWYAIAYGQPGGSPKWVSTTGSGGKSAVSSDGSSWGFGGDLPEIAGGYRAVTYGNGYFVTVSYNGSYRLAWSDDGGSTWNVPADFPHTEKWRAVAYGDGKMVTLSSTATDEQQVAYALV